MCLCLFAPICVYADGGVVLGDDIHEKNIPLKMDVLDKTIAVMFKEDADLGILFKEDFYEYIYNDMLDVPFSMQDLFMACRKQSLGTTLFCVDFVKLYVKGISEAEPSDMNEMPQFDITNSACARASALVDIDIKNANGTIYRFKTFKEALNRCESMGHSGAAVNQDGKVVHNDLYTLDSIYGICQRFLTNVDTCKSELETFYTEGLNKAKTRELSECVLKLIKTGQMDLPVNLMEEKCGGSIRTIRIEGLKKMKEKKKEKEEALIEYEKMMREQE